MNDRYFIAAAFGLSWLVLGWGCYGFVRVRRWMQVKRRANAARAHVASGVTSDAE